ncbi:MAG TPA: hypothetical protein VMB18_03600 [Terriglobales bacterium]|nr:hypothetical protein [Terriglobales bacterium]
MHWWNSAIRLHDARYCAPQCFENALQQHFLRLSVATAAAPPVQHRIPLGLLMLSRGQLTNQQLRSALEAQSASGRRLGECLEKLGFATEQQVTAALGLQWACPVLMLRDNPDRECVHLLPYRLLEQFRMLPLQFVAATRTFYFAFSDGIDYPALYAIEQMLECRTEACLISSSAMNRALEQIGHEPRPGDFLFEGWRRPPEMSRITCSYVLKFGARDVRVVGCGGLIWVRLRAGRDVGHLLFRQPLAVIEPPSSASAAPPLRITG